MPFPRTPHAPARRSRLRPALGVAVTSLTCLALAGCGGNQLPGAAPGAQPVSAPKAEVSGNPDTWPLTGLMVESGESIQEHPVLVLKMDNPPGSAPQQGLGSADLVVEELVEGGVTRLAAFYYSSIPDAVGPVRSMRASDIGIVTPVDASMVTSGAASVTISRIRDAGIPYFNEDSAGFYRESSRPSPYNLFTDLGEIADQAATTPGRPADYLPFGSADALPAGQAATSIEARFSPARTTTWSFDDGRYVNDNGFAGEDDQFPADTVLVLKVKVGDAGYRDPAGNKVPETEFVGGGEAMLFHGGRLVRGTWAKPGLDSALALSTQAGDLVVPPGRTWIELVPQDGGDVTFD